MQFQIEQIKSNFIQKEKDAVQDVLKRLFKKIGITDYFKVLLEIYNKDEIKRILFLVVSFSYNFYFKVV